MEAWRRGASFLGVAFMAFCLYRFNFCCKDAVTSHEGYTRIIETISGLREDVVCQVITVSVILYHVRAARA